MTATAKATIEAEIAEILRTEVHMETNQGTYGNQEACRKVGSGSPEFANREVYETVGGIRRETGPSEDRAPGCMRHIGHTTMDELRAKLAELRKQLKSR